MPRTKETIMVDDRNKATGKASKPNKGAPQPKQKPPAKPQKWPQKYSELTVYDVKQTEVQAACVEIQIVNSPVEPPTYGEQILLLTCDGTIQDQRSGTKRVPDRFFLQPFR